MAELNPLAQAVLDAHYGAPTMSKPLSPAAQAVLDAITAVSPAPADEIAAAALRAAADHLDDHANRLLFGGRYHGMIMAIELLQSIATQLEGATPGSSTH